MGTKLRFADHETTEEQDAELRGKAVNVFRDFLEVFVLSLFDEVGGRCEADRRIAWDRRIGRVTKDVPDLGEVVEDLGEIDEFHRHPGGNGPCEHGCLGVHLVVAIAVIAELLASDQLVHELPRPGAAESAVVVVRAEVVKLTGHVVQIGDDAAVPVLLEGHVFHELPVVQFHFEMDQTGLHRRAHIVGDGPVGVEVASSDDHDLIVQLVQAHHAVEYQFIPYVQIRSLILSRIINPATYFYVEQTISTPSA